VIRVYLFSPATHTMLAILTVDATSREQGLPEAQEAVTKWQEDNEEAFYWEAYKEEDGEWKRV